MTFILLLGSLSLSALGAYGLYHAFKPYESKIDVTEDSTNYSGDIFGIVIVILSLFRDNFSRHAYIKIYKSTAFLFGLVMFGLAIWIWTLDKK